MSSITPSDAASHTPPLNTVTSLDNQQVYEQSDPRNVSHPRYRTVSEEHITDRPPPQPHSPQSSSRGAQPSHTLSPLRRRSDSPAISSEARPKKKRMRVSGRRADEGSADERRHHQRESPSPSPSLSSDDDDDEGREDEPSSVAGQSAAATAATGSASAGAPPKKKRTRTLTTPYQAQRLHELLAQVM